MHLLKESWQFCLKITENATRTSSEKPQLRVSRLYFTCVFRVSVACFKDSTWHSYKQFFLVITKLSWGHLNVRYKPALRVRSAIFVHYCIKCKQSTPASRHGGYAWWRLTVAYSPDSNILSSRLIDALVCRKLSFCRLTVYRRWTLGFYASIIQFLLWHGVKRSPKA